jgi:hypothetical protein
MLHRATCAVVMGLLLLGSGCLVRSASDESALPRESRDPRDQPPPGLLRNFLRDKETHAVPGLFVTYSHRGKWYLLVRGHQLHTPLMWMTRVSQGTGRDTLDVPLGMLTGSSVKNTVVTFERHGNRLFLIEQPHRYLQQVTDRKMVERTFSPNVVASLPILAEGPPPPIFMHDGVPLSRDVLVGLDDLLLEDLVASVPSGRDHQRPTRKLSYLERLSGTATSTSLRVRLGYPGGVVTELGHTVNSVAITYSLLQLPETPMLRRVADDRIGVFSTVFRDFHSPSPDLEAHAITRWRLTPDHREGSLWVPKQPIVFYLDPATPEAYQPYILDGIRQWNRAFEAAGWKDAVRAAVLPSKLAMDDPRLAIVHWDVGEHSLNGRGQRLVDPRSGEILGAALVMSLNPQREQLRFRQTVLAPGLAAQSQEDLPDDDRQELLAVLGDQSQVLRAVLLSKGALAAKESLPDELLGRRLRLLAMHEVGHSLGLQHNFRASTLTPSEQLASPQWFQRSPLLASVMEYAAINLPPLGAPLPSERDFPYYQATIGPADVLSIAYAYTLDPSYAAYLAGHAAEWGYSFGSDDEANSEADPSVQRWDLGSEPLIWAKDRTALLRELWQKLASRGLQPGERPAEVTAIASALLHDYSRAVGTVPAYIGGRYGSRDHIGDPKGKPASRPVEKSKQTAALAFLLDAVFAESALPVTPALAQQLGEDYLTPRRRAAIKQTTLPLWRQILEMRIGMLYELLEARRLRRMVDGEQAFGRDAVLTVGELLSQLNRALFSEIVSGTPGTLSPLRRELQLRYVEMLGGLVLHITAESRHARSQARFQLQQLASQLEQLRPKRDSYDPDTRAHLVELADSISATVNGATVIHTGPDFRSSESAAQTD